MNTERTFRIIFILWLGIGSFLFTDAIHKERQRLAALERRLWAIEQTVNGIEEFRRYMQGRDVEWQKFWAGRNYLIITNSLIGTSIYTTNIIIQQDPQGTAHITNWTNP